MFGFPGLIDSSRIAISAFALVGCRARHTEGMRLVQRHMGTDDISEMFIQIESPGESASLHDWTAECR